MEIPYISKLYSSLMGEDPPVLTTEPGSPLILSAVSRQGGFLHDISAQLGTKNNEFDRADLVVKLDERISDLIELMAVMIQKSYAGIGLIQDDKELTETEKNILKTAKSFASNPDIDFQTRMYEYAFPLFKYGDIIERIITEDSTKSPITDIHDSLQIGKGSDEKEKEKGIIGLDPLPRNQLTIIDKEDRLKKGGTGLDTTTTTAITKSKFYVLDEENNDITEREPILYDREEILHIPFNKRGNWKKDLMDRPTFNIWSNAPIESVMYLIEWKHNLIRNDMLWREKMLPREHYQLDMSLFIPDNYDGDTFQERVNAAKVAAKKALDDFGVSVKNKRPDQSVITPDSVTFKIVEPSSTNYHDPNDMINQIDSKISGITGAPSPLLGGESSGAGGFTALVHSSTFFALRAEIYAMKITKGLEKLLKKHVRMLHPSVGEDTINRLYIKNRLILDRDLAERAKIVAILTTSKSFTQSEIREVMGKDPMTDVQMKELIKWLKETGQMDEETAGKTAKSVVDDANKKTGTNETAGQQSQVKRENDEFGIGESIGEGSTKNLTR